MRMIGAAFAAAMACSSAAAGQWTWQPTGESFFEQFSDTCKLAGRVASTEWESCMLTAAARLRPVLLMLERDMSATSDLCAAITDTVFDHLQCVIETGEAIMAMPAERYGQ